ncbi:MAG: Thiazole synthase, partial [uncultured Craurococcus sp.]
GRIATACPGRQLGGRRPALPLAPDRGHRALQGPRGDGAGHRGLRRRDRHRRRAPGQSRRPEGADAAGLRRPAALHLPAEHRRLLHRRGCRAHPAPGARGGGVEPRQARGAGAAALPLPGHAGDLRGAGGAAEGRLPGHGLLLGRPGRGAAPGGDGRGRHHAARCADRLRPRHPEPGDDPGDHRAGARAGAGRCRRRHRFRCGLRHGARLRRGADEQRHRPCAGSGADGAGDEGGGGGGAAGLPRRADAAATRGRPVEPARQGDHRPEL